MIQEETMRNTCTQAGLLLMLIGLILSACSGGTQTQTQHPVKDSKKLDSDVADDEEPDPDELIALEGKSGTSDKSGKGAKAGAAAITDGQFSEDEDTSDDDADTEDQADESRGGESQNEFLESGDDSDPSLLNDQGPVEGIDSDD